MDGIANHFLAIKALDCRIFTHNLSNFSRGHIPGPRAPVFEPRHQFPLGSPAFPLFLFYETTSGINDALFLSSLRYSSKRKVNRRTVADLIQKVKKQWQQTNHVQWNTKFGDFQHYTAEWNVHYNTSRKKNSAQVKIIINYLDLSAVWSWATRCGGDVYRNIGLF